MHDPLQGFGGMIAGGVLVTLRIAAGSLVLACAFGLAGALAKGSGSRVVRAVAGAYSTLVRGLPELVLMLAVFYGGQYLVNLVCDTLGAEDLDVPPALAGTLTIGFIYGAYLCETFRGAFLAIPRGQFEAARAFGYPESRILVHIALPQMIRHAIPGFANIWLVMIKATALVSLIGLDDMVHRANLAASSTRAPFTFYMLTAVLYLAITSVSIAILGRIERRYSLGVRRVEF
jgi:His/Glu/Gln/Arg/opine family amino acid ABC transporter permease subunit